MVFTFSTEGQCYTSTRRLLIHKDLYKYIIENLVDAYKKIKIGDYINSNNHMCPLIDQDAVNKYISAIQDIKNTGGKFYMKEILFLEKVFY